MNRFKEKEWVKDKTSGKDEENLCKHYTKSLFDNDMIAAVTKIVLSLLSSTIEKIIC